MSANVTEPHRGRVQAQGGGFEASEPWAQPAPPTDIQGHELLETLHDKLPAVHQQCRRLAFAQAHRYVDAVAAAGGTGPTKKSFPNRGLKRADPRVDIEVHKGLAFVPAHP